MRYIHIGRGDGSLINMTTYWIFQVLLEPLFGLIMRIGIFGWTGNCKYSIECYELCISLTLIPLILKLLHKHRLIMIPYLVIGIHTVYYGVICLGLMFVSFKCAESANSHYESTKIAKSKCSFSQGKLIPCNCIPCKTFYADNNNDNRKKPCISMEMIFLKLSCRGFHEWRKLWILTHIRHPFLKAIKDRLVPWFELKKVLL